MAHLRPHPPRSAYPCLVFYTDDCIGKGLRRLGHRNILSPRRRKQSQADRDRSVTRRAPCLLCLLLLSKLVGYIIFWDLYVPGLHHLRDLSGRIYSALVLHLAANGAGRTQDLEDRAGVLQSEGVSAELLCDV
eukprot:XP_001708606.1 Hypothetical protein GL50803_18794 [Giardia lamblia ATCC 50803]